MSDGAVTVPPTVRACCGVGGDLVENRLVESSPVGGPGSSKVGFFVRDDIPLSNSEGLAASCDIPWLSCGSTNESARSSAVIPVGLWGALGAWSFAVGPRCLAMSSERLEGALAGSASII
jgi:hypothetical protein